MVALYCRDHHADRDRSDADEDLCDECAALQEYALRRLGACRYGADKPTCANCPTHCYKPAMRERVREVMRYSGPRMMKRHPVLAVAHLLDGRKQAPGAGDRGPGGEKPAGGA